MTADSEIRRWLEDRVDLERGDKSAPVPGGGTPPPDIARMSELAALLGDPQTAFPIVHVTGTNGKTSTVRMTAALLAARGLTVGLYTSPHLRVVNERLARNGEPIDDDSFDEVLDRVRRVEEVMAERPSYFELVTAAAFSWFSDIAVDVAVVEVGLGGMWDATNVGEARVAVVTNVAIDHVEYLGPDRYAIAKEKAGIVTEGCSLVLGETDPELTPLFVDSPRPERVHRRDVDFGVLDNVMAHNGRLVRLLAPSGSYPDLFLPFHGAHQADNAACALAAAETFFGEEGFAPDVVATAMAGLEIPGRLEVVARQPLVLLDGAHNVEGARALQVALDEEFPADERTLVVGLLREKEPHEMLEALGASDAARLVVCRPPSPRALDPEVLVAAAKNVGVPSPVIEVADAVPEAVARALAITPVDGQIVVTGSVYTVGAARDVFVG